MGLRGEKNKSTVIRRTRRINRREIVALDVASRFVVSLKVGQRTTADLRAFIGDFATRSGGTPPALLTTDDCVTYAQMIGLAERPLSIEELLTIQIVGIASSAPTLDDFAHSLGPAP